jgi:serralysin
MVQVTIQNFPVDASDIAGVIDLEGVEVSGEPSITPTQIAATLSDGRGITIVGTFQPVIDALAAGNLDLLLTGIEQIRLDAVSVSVGGVTWIVMTGIDLTGPEVLAYLDASDIDDETDVGDDDIDAGISFLFTGNDTIVSALGDDTLRGYGGDDIVLGMSGNDLVYGDAGNDEVNGNLGNDTVHGGQGTDFVRGGQGTDLVYGEDGDDWHVNGNIGNDTVYGGLGNDSVFGGQGNDFLIGDIFEYGVGGNDFLIGNLGNDTLVGDPGNDTLQGGEGTDTFSIYTGDGRDVIVDFDPATEVIELEPNINGIGYTAASNFSVLSARITADGLGNSVIDLGAGHSLRIDGVLPGQLQAGNFDFIF